MAGARSQSRKPGIPYPEWRIVLTGKDSSMHQSQKSAFMYHVRTLPRVGNQVTGSLAAIFPAIGKGL